MASSDIDEYLSNLPNPPNIYPHQKDAIDWMKHRWDSKEPILLGDSMGLGKTIDVCMFLELIRVQKALVVVPTSTIYQWVRSLLKYCPNYYVYVNTNHKIRQVILSDDDKIIHSDYANINILNNIDHCNVTVCNYHSVVPFPGIPTMGGMTGNKQEVQRSLEEYIPEMTPFNDLVWDVVIADEIHKIRNGVNTKLDPGEARKKMLMYYRMSRLRMKPDHSIRVGLSGTPVQNRFSDAVSIMTWLGCKFPPRPTLDSVKQMLMSVMFRRTENDLHPVLRSLILFPEVQPNEHNIDVIYESPAEADLYKIVAGSMSGIEIPGMHLNPYSRVQYEENPLVRTNYLRLLSADINQFIKSHNERHKSSKLPYWQGTNSKINMIANKIAELAGENESVIVFVHYKEERDSIREKVWYKSHEMGMGPTFGYHEYWIDGDVEPEDREFILYETKKKIEAGQRCIVYATMQSSSDGLNMQHFCKIIISTTDWNPANELQAIKRTHRIGQKRVVDVYRYIHRYVIDLKNTKHIDVTIEERKSKKIAKSDELITDVYNAARYWNIRTLPDFYDEPSVIFSDLSHEETDRQISNYVQGRNIHSLNDDVRRPDESYYERLIGPGAGVRVYNASNDTPSYQIKPAMAPNISDLVDDFYRSVNIQDSSRGMSIRGNTAKVSNKEQTVRMHSNVIPPNFGNPLVGTSNTITNPTDRTSNTITNPSGNVRLSKEELRKRYQEIYGNK